MALILGLPNSLAQTEYGLFLALDMGFARGFGPFWELAGRKMILFNNSN